MKINTDGYSAYEILKMEGCPFTLPRARSMTQARIDFEFIEDRVMEWYEHNKGKKILSTQINPNANPNS